MNACANLRIELPSFLLETGVSEERSQGEAIAALAGHPVRVVHRFFRPGPYFTTRNGAVICVLGLPILGDRIDIAGVCDRLPEGLEDQDFLRSLDGEFLLLVIEKGERLRLVSSRFCSPPLFYYHNGATFLASFAFEDLWQRLHALGLARLREDSLYHLLAYKRVFGHGTHEQGTRLIPPASVLTFDGGTVTLSRYYLPDFTRKTTAPLPACADALSERITAAIRRKASDNPRAALFLSGGMDTRTLLAHFAAMGVLPACFTMNQFRNREVQVAAALARMVGAPHWFLPFFPDHYPLAFEDALRIVGAQQHPNCMFLGFGDQVAPHADVAFHGHGFDYFFQGMYLPAVHPLRTKRHTLLYRYLYRLSGKVTDFFLENISYRIRDFDVDSLIRQDRLADVKASLRSDVETVAKEAAEISDSPYDVLEYLTFYNLARHYTYADHWSLNTLLPQRTISFDNALYDLYQSLPPKHRFDGRIMRACLTRINPDMARFMSANHTFPANASSSRMTLLQLQGYALRRLGLKKSWENEEFQRMGLPFGFVFGKELRSWVEKLPTSERLASVSFLDMDKVGNYVRKFLEHPGGKGQLLLSLISIDQLLKRGEKAGGHSLP